jgi:catechol 2,3-dioxygenase-like lactoylglutathione lyase family enzyme
MIARDEWVDSDAGNWQHLAFEVASVDDTYAELTALGIAFHVEPKDVPADAPVARIAFFRDPDGNSLELFQPIGGRYPQGGA